MLQSQGFKKLPSEDSDSTECHTVEKRRNPKSRPRQKSRAPVQLVYDANGTKAIKELNLSANFTVNPKNPLYMTVNN